MPGSLTVTLRKSVVSSIPDVRRTASALGLRKIGDTSTLPDNPAVRGQIRWQLEEAWRLLGGDDSDRLSARSGRDA